MSTLAERLTEALNDNPDLSAAGLAKACGVSKSAVHGWQNGGDIKVSNFFTLAAYLKVRPEWLALGKGRKSPSPDEYMELVPGVHARDNDNELDPDSYVLVEKYNAQFSAGGGNVVWAIKEKDPISFRRGWFDYKRLSPANCKAGYVKGRSMEPKLEDGDVVLIDISQTDPIEGEIYAFFYKGGFFIKTYEPMGIGVRLKSENPEFKSIEIAPEEMSDLKIVGKKVWRGG